MLSGVFADYSAPIVRNARDGVRAFAAGLGRLGELPTGAPVGPLQGKRRLAQFSGVRACVMFS